MTSSLRAGGMSPPSQPPQPATVYRMLHTERARPHVPAPLWDFIDTHILFNGNTSLPMGPPSSGGGVSSPLGVAGVGVGVGGPRDALPPSRVLKTAPAPNKVAASLPAGDRGSSGILAAATGVAGAGGSGSGVPLGGGVGHHRVAPGGGVGGGVGSSGGGAATISSSPLSSPLTPSTTATAPLSPSALPINIQALKIHMMREGSVSPNDAVAIVNRCKEIMTQEPNLLHLAEPVVVVGDIHGQYYDLVKLLEIGGDVGGSQTYLFLGDYVDRGCFSCECVLLLYALKICYPNHVYLLRGNHEGRHLTSYFSFKAECYYKYTPEFYDACMLSFDALPLAAMIGTRFFCVHGGLSPEVIHVEEVSFINRFREIPTSGAMCDLLWSDPHWDVENPVVSGQQHSGGGGSNILALRGTYFETEPLFTPNDSRGCSYLFNCASLHQFINTNNLLAVIRAHEAQDEGYKLFRPHQNTHFPAMLSIFSAPNYVDSYDNKGAIAIIKSGQLSIKQFFSSPHPYVLPNFMNAFEWSLPFVVEKLRDLFTTVHTVIAQDSTNELFSGDEESDEALELELARERSAGSSSGGAGASPAGLVRFVASRGATGVPSSPATRSVHDVAEIVRLLGAVSLLMKRRNRNTTLTLQRLQ